MKFIKSESKVIALETDMKELKADYESKITNLESSIAAKDIHIKQLVYCLTPDLATFEFILDNRVDLS